MAYIEDIKALEILDSRGHPTLEVTVFTEGGAFSASVPSGASTGKYEAKELRDGGRRYFSLGVRKAVQVIEKKIAPRLRGMSVFTQSEIDLLLVDLDHSKGKGRFGANALLAVSLACARAGAHHHGLPLFAYLWQLSDFGGSVRGGNLRMPQLYMNVLNGGKHAGNKLAIQEFMIVPQSSSFAKNLQIASEVYHALGNLIEREYGSVYRSVGDEGGFAPPIRDPEEALDLLKKAVRKAGYSLSKVRFALDCAASEFYSEKRRPGKGSAYLLSYQLHKKFSPGALQEYYLKLVKKYKLVSLEDPFEQEDFSNFAELRAALRKKKLKCQIVGDDLTVTNVDRIEKAADAGSCDCLLLKMNQIGTLSEALGAARVARDAGWKVMVSHRSGETCDSFIADLAVGLGCGMIKAGAPSRGERVAKYNQLLRIERYKKIHCL